MKKEEVFLIDRKEGFGEEFSKLISMMAYVRATTIAEVQGLSAEELDFRFQEDANSIGMLLAHMDSVERFYQIDTFEKREVTEDDVLHLNPGLELGDAARGQIHSQPAEHYLQKLEESRKKTLDTFSTLPDSWLFEQAPFWYNEPTNNYFKWFHVFEDELNHRGQIRLIKKMLKTSVEA